MSSESQVLIATEVSSGLKAAYHENLIHRDIKPGNVLLTDDGVSKLVDFGLALQQGGTDESDEIWATPYYVPPEKLDDEPDTFLGDIYSLGASLFHILAGVPPFEADTASIEELKVIKRKEVNLRAVARGIPGMAKLVEEMMAYKPSARPQSYDLILARLNELKYNPNAGVDEPVWKTVFGGSFHQVFNWLGYGDHCHFNRRCCISERWLWGQDLYG